MHGVTVARWTDLPDRSPEHALVANVDLVIVRLDDEVRVLYGRCLHRGVGIATQNDHLRARLEIIKSATRLCNYLLATTELMQVLARACGHHRLADFELRDLTTWKREVADLTGVAYGGVVA